MKLCEAQLWLCELTVEEAAAYAEARPHATDRSGILALHRFAEPTQRHDDRCRVQRPASLDQRSNHVARDPMDRIVILAVDVRLLGPDIARRRLLTRAIAPISGSESVRPALRREPIV